MSRPRLVAGATFEHPPCWAALHFPLPNRGIDITLTGPATAQEVRTTAAALAEAVDCRIWDDWGGLEGGPARR
jgi:hypothetical protein